MLSRRARNAVVPCTIAAAVACALADACSSAKPAETPGADAGAEAGEGGACPGGQPEAGSTCSGQTDCPYGCGTTYCSCPYGFWQCSIVLHGEGGACETVDGTPVPEAGAACAGACGPFVGTTCSFLCPGGQGPISAICGTSGWRVLGACGAED